MGLYDNLAATSLKLLSQFGQNVTRRRTATGTYDPDAGSGSQTPTDTTWKGALFDFKEGQKEITGTLIVSGDKLLLIEAAAAPVPSDKFVVGGVEYSVLGVREISPAGTPVLYKAHLRK